MFGGGTVSKPKLYTFSNSAYANWESHLNINIDGTSISTIYSKDGSPTFYTDPIINVTPDNTNHYWVAKLVRPAKVNGQKRDMGYVFFNTYYGSAWNQSFEIQSN